MPRLSQRHLILRDAYRSLEYACRDQILAETDEELRQAYELADDIFEAIRVQLVLAFERLGMNGNGADVKRIARTAGVADGTVTLYTDRVISALVRLSSEFVRWQQPEDRREISVRIAQRSGIGGAVGSLTRPTSTLHNDLP
ncbi:hypothetical protein PsorP6_017570 [Peronosclerospora sorghi]|uniref:Uncharacterized protein n=1 Tax=Peronosclerospora sorghi TaxID=230839 RepID=A0ACC0WNF6_9STRA|nr:hypothetical protein PsorP6_017570 [Peronosclerospora sorghi]